MTEEFAIIGGSKPQEDLENPSDAGFRLKIGVCAAHV